MKILYLHNMTQISGGERSLLNLWEHLDHEQFEPYLMVPGKGELSAAAEDIGVRVSFFEVPQLRPRNIFALVKAAWQFHCFLRSNHIDIIHSYAPRNNVLSALAAMACGVPVIWHERNLIYGQEPDITAQFFALPARVICNSQAVARRFVRKKGHVEKVKVVLNGVNLEKFKPGREDRALKAKLGLEGMDVVGMVTNLNARKRVSFLLEAVPLVLRNVPNAKFVVVGGEFPDEGGRQMAELQTLVDRLGIQKHVVFAGFQDDVGPYLNVLDVFAHVTVKEACSRAILEAMACAKAVVAINDGGNPELVEHGETGFLVGIDDREDFAQKISGLLLDGQKRTAMGQKGRARAEQLFDVKRNAQQTQEIYLEVLECHA